MWGYQSASLLIMSVGTDRSLNRVPSQYLGRVDRYDTINNLVSVVC